MANNDDFDSFMSIVEKYMHGDIKLFRTIYAINWDAKGGFS